MEEHGDWDHWIENEANTPKVELLETLQNLTDAETKLAPAIAAKMERSEFDVMFLYGIGEVFPFIRSHTVLNNLQRIAKSQPTVLFFPGDYSHSLEEGASLDSHRGRLETLATEARAAAEQAVTSKVQKLASIEGDDQLSDAQKQQIESIVYETIEQIKSQPLIAVVKEAASRFMQKEYTDILGKVNSWTQKPEETATDDLETKPKPAWKPPVEFIGISHLSVSFERPWLESEPDITAYLTLLRQAMLDAIDAGKRIQV